MGAVNLEKLGKRHLDGNPGEVFSDSKKSAPPIRISSDEEFACTFSGQQTLWVVANLLARQFGVVPEIEISVPNVITIEGVAAFGLEEYLPDTLKRTIELISNEKIPAVFTNDIPKPDTIEVFVGRSPVAVDGWVRIIAIGNGWEFFVGSRIDNEFRSGGWRNEPIGPCLAACFAAGEVFKKVVGLRPGKGSYIDRLHYSVWHCEEVNGQHLPEVPCIDIDLPPFYLIGAGAVGQSFAMTIALFENVRGYSVVIDDDSLDGTNLNRHILATFDDIDNKKSEIVATHFNANGIETSPSNKRWPAYIFDNNKSELPGSLVDQEKAFKFEHVISCVDKNPSRHSIQKYWPKTLMGGSTLDLATEVNIYDMQSEYECLMCSNPVDQEEKLTTGKVAERLKGLTREELREFANEHDLDLEAVFAYLKAPECGMLGETEILRFIENSESGDWSVGFVSTAAGVLLAAQFIKNNLNAPTLLNGNCLRANFLNPKLFTTKHRRKTSCECTTVGSKAYSSLWLSG
jgi:hypothetical protein